MKRLYFAGAVLGAILSTAAAQEGRVTAQTGHGEAIRDLAFSADGAELISAGDDDTIVTWNVASGRQVRSIAANCGGIRKLSVANRRNEIAASCLGGTLQFWKSSGQSVGAVPAEKLIGHVLSPDATLLAWYAEDGSIVLFERATVKKSVLQSEGSPVVSAAFSPDGKRLLTGNWKGEAVIWDLATRKIVTSEAGAGPGVTAVAFSPDGTMAISARRDGSVKVWNAATGAAIRELRGHTAGVWGVAWSKNGTLVTTSDDGAARIWDPSTGAQRFLLSGHEGNVRPVAISPDGKTVATAAGDLRIRLWDASTGKLLRTLERLVDPIVAGAQSADGRYIATAAGNEVRVWDLREGGAPRRLAVQFGEILSVAFSPDGKQLAAGLTGSNQEAKVADAAGKQSTVPLTDFTVAIWNLEKPQAAGFVQAHKKPVHAVAFSPDGRYLVSASEDHTAAIWDIARQSTARELRGHTGPIHGLAYSPDGRRIATADYDGVVRLWDAATGAEIRRMETKTPLTSAAFSPDSTMVAAGDFNGNTFLWNVSSGAEIHRWKAVPPIHTVAFSPDGRRLLSAGAQVKEWSTADFRELSSVADTGEVRFAAYSNDKGLIVAGMDGVLRVRAGQPREFALVGEKAGGWIAADSSAWERDSKANVAGAYWISESVTEFRDRPGRRKSGLIHELLEPRITLKIQQTGVPSMFSRDHRFLAAGEHLIDTETGREVCSFSSPIKGFTPDSSSVLTLQSLDGLSSLSSCKTEDFTDTTSSANTWTHKNLALSPDGKWFLNVDGHGVPLVTLQAPGNADADKTLDSDDAVWPDRALFSVDGKIVALQPGQAFDTGTAKPIPNFPKDAVGFAANGDVLLSGSNVAAGWRWNRLTGQKTALFTGLAGESLTSCTADVRLCLTTGKDGVVHLRDVRSGAELRRFPKGSAAPAFFSPDGERLLAGNQIWDISQPAMRLVSRYEASSVSAEFVSFDKGMRSLTVGRAVWDIESGLPTFGPAKRVEPVKSSPPQGTVSADGRYSAEVKKKGDSAVIEIKSRGKVVRTLDLSYQDISQMSLAFTPDSKALYASGTELQGNAGGVTGYFLLQPLEGGEDRGFESFESPVSAIEFSPSGHYALTGTEAGAITTWKTGTGEQLCSAESPRGGVVSAAISPDDRFALVGTSRGAELFEMAGCRHVATLATFGEKGWAVVADNGLFDTSDLDGTTPLHWIHEDDPLRPLPLELFTRQYYTPGLLNRILNGNLPSTPSISSLNLARPEVTIASVEADPAHAGALRVKVSVKQSSGKLGPAGVRDLRLFRDGQMVAIDPRKLPDGEYQFDAIRLPHAATARQLELTAYAFNEQLVKSATARASYTLPAGPAVRPKAFLLNIGVNYSAGAGCALNYAVQDATILQQVLKDRLPAYDVRAKLLTSSTGTDDGARRDLIAAAFADVARSAGPDDLLIVTFSGHGLSGSDGQFYLFPSDVSGDCGSVDASMKASAISGDLLAKWLQGIDAGEMVMILDACFSAASVQSGDFKPAPIGGSGLGQLAFDKRMRILAASQATQPAGEAGAIGMGYLSYSLAKAGLERGLADWQPKDGVVWLREWLSYGVQAVPKLYEVVREGKSPDALSRSAGRLGGNGAAQKPVLFDFRSESDAGPKLARGER